jgi:hypothetical protein
MVFIMSHMPPIAFIGMVEVMAVMPWMPGVVPDIGIVAVTVPVPRMWAPGVPIGIIRCGVAGVGVVVPWAKTPMLRVTRRTRAVRPAAPSNVIRFEVDIDAPYVDRVPEVSPELAPQPAGEINIL